jgi:hypothetical protein
MQVAVGKGQIRTTLDVWCGRCGNWENLDAFTKRAAGVIARQKGWQNTRQKGWVCPLCSNIQLVSIEDLPQRGPAWCGRAMSCCEECGEYFGYPHAVTCSRRAVTHEPPW